MRLTSRFAARCAMMAFPASVAGAMVSLATALPARAAPTPDSVTGIGYVPDAAEAGRAAASQANDLSHPMSLSYGSDGLADTASGGSTSTALGGAQFADDADAADGALPGHHRLHGSVTAFVGSHGMAGGGMEVHTPSLGNSGIAASVSVGAARLPSYGSGRYGGGNLQTAAVSLAKRFEDGSEVGLSLGYARLANGPYGYGPYPYGPGPHGAWGGTMLP